MTLKSNITMPSTKKRQHPRFKRGQLLQSDSHGDNLVLLAAIDEISHTQLITVVVLRDAGRPTMDDFDEADKFEPGRIMEWATSRLVPFTKNITLHTGDSDED